MTRGDVREFAFAYAKANQVACPRSWLKNGRAGEGWLIGFLNDTPSSLLVAARASVWTGRGGFATPPSRSSTTRWRTSSMHTTSRRNESTMRTRRQCSPHLHTNPVLAPKGVRNVGHLTSAERGQLTTALCAFNCDGESVPPVFFFNRARMEPDLLLGAPPGSAGFANPGGWICTRNFIRYLTHFACWTNACREKSVLLILDHHSLHRAVTTAVVARSLGVDLVTLPPTPVTGCSRATWGSTDR
eukprot:GHVU01058751.1.p1 GENE.GHVU01058751.1~~GHVU01058751.1.p1  ORF type:complete len:244 (-),score=0.44 GHVU01058751.1:505-1236(-)